MKKTIFVLLVFLLVGGVTAYLMINKSHVSMANIKSDVIITASVLFSDYEMDEKKANYKYLDKIIEIEGEVMQVNVDENGKIKVHLHTDDMIFGVICELDDFYEHTRTSFVEAENIKLKCLCIGYLSDVILIRCIELKKSKE